MPRPDVSVAQSVCSSPTAEGISFEQLTVRHYSFSTTGRELITVGERWNTNPPVNFTLLLHSLMNTIKRASTHSNRFIHTKPEGGNSQFFKRCCGNWLISSHCFSFREYQFLSVSGFGLKYFGHISSIPWLSLFHVHAVVCFPHVDFTQVYHVDPFKHF